MQLSKPLKISITLSLDEPIVKKIRILANEDERTASSCINLVLRRYLHSLSSGGEQEKPFTRNPSVHGTKPAKARMNVSLDGPMVDKLRVLAEENDRQLSTYINLILRDYLQNFDANKKDG